MRKIKVQVPFQSDEKNKRHPTLHIDLKSSGLISLLLKPDYSAYDVEQIIENVLLSIDDEFRSAWIEEVVRIDITVKQSKSETTRVFLV